MFTLTSIPPQVTSLTDYAPHISFLADTIDWICRTHRLVDPVTRKYVAPRAHTVDAIRLPVIVPARGIAFEDLVVLFGDRRVFAGVRLSENWDRPADLEHTLLTESVELAVRSLHNAAQPLDESARIRYLAYTPAKHH
ncbi:hypothetical protein ACRAWC_01710 [Leifsonia sp. L25]|uniref:hypothetical protein n=1 Tax=Actinomycetes TaxID=1760 RepID=UPI003D6983C9